MGNHTIVIFDDSGTYLQRLFCVLELASTRAETLEIRMSESQLACIQSGVEDQSLVLNCINAECRSKRDTKRIHSFINDMGGHHRVDAMVAHVINLQARQNDWNFHMRTADAEEELHVIAAMVNDLSTQGRSVANGVDLIFTEDLSVELTPWTGPR